MTQEQVYLDSLKDIRQIMNRSTRFISLSGLSGVFAGMYAIIGAWVAYYKFGYRTNLGFYNEITAADFQPSELVTFILLDAIIVLVLSLSTALFLTQRRAKKNNQRVFDKIGMQMITNLFIPLVAGGIFCLLLLKYGEVRFIAPATLVFYGLALVNGSKYTLDEVRYLGYCEVILGLLAMNFLGYGLLFWIIGFGVLHIVYGLMMWNKYERKPTADAPGE
jgi:hypothetical protein